MSEEIREDEQVEVRQPKPRKPRKRYTAEEARAILESGRNAKGLGGVKMQRVNMSFSPQNYDYIKICSRGLGLNYTEFVNMVMDDYRANHNEQYELAVKLRDSFKNN